MKIVLTGATGFIGRHLCKALFATPHTVTVLCRDTASPGLDWLAGQGVVPSAIAVDLDSAGDDIYERIGAPDVLIHLAWEGVGNVQSPLHMTRELPRHFTFLSRLIEGGLPRMVIAGSCSEYGLQNGSLKETQPCHPSTWYGLAKYSLLRQLEFMQSGRSFELLWTRPFYTYGEGQNPNSLYPQLMRALAKKERSFRMSGGEQLRDYLPVKEMARMLCDLATSKRTGVVNVCSGRPTTVRRMVENWLAEHNASIALDLGHYPYRDFEPFAFWGDAERLRNYLSI
ncbi:nucleoside-diphosphate-sugar epimerase [Ereboglobus sp. PH5-5]|uniref:NAD-dependent epimerase/dehydratase family protein n=1 Tax=Ereboglobus sp. PH5-5 TaxID=2940529 RepID=UPI0024069BE7|nr:NAD(P)-dependent oxidoreductase [Ereboglobus sp. PH5-5]MDF9833996.1 nucleoside-diphosphate-sugar epimerase [Ereboglobus sp. PH5-5]